MISSNKDRFDELVEKVKQYNDGKNVNIICSKANMQQLKYLGYDCIEEEMLGDDKIYIMPKNPKNVIKIKFKED